MRGAETSQILGRTMRIQCLMLAVIAMGSRESQLAAQSSLVEQIDSQVVPYLEEKVLVGLSVGIIKSGKYQTLGYGSVSSDASEVPTSKTIYEIGSISKVFTGVLLGDAVLRGEVTLETTLEQIAPKEFARPHASLLGIQLVHLATHTSGLPRLPSNLDLGNTRDPYGSYAAKELFEFLGDLELSGPPGVRMEYSNLGAGLLGELLAQQANMSYEQLLKDRITGPLDMEDTLLTLNPEQEKRFALPYLESGLPATNWGFKALAGAGAIRSTVDDLLIFSSACLKAGGDYDLDSGIKSSGDGAADNLHKALALAWQNHLPATASDASPMGLNWHFAQDGVTRFHNGQTGGYHSMLLINTELEQAVVLLSNTATMELDRLAGDIFKVVAGRKVEPRRFEKYPKIPGEIMKRYEGQYQLLPGAVFTVFQVDEKLHVELTGQPAYQVFPRSETEWAFKVVEATITFQVDEDGKCNELTLLQNGVRQTAKRLK